jgi:hypothetical protein
MPRASTRRRSEIVDTINAALEIVDDVAKDEDGDSVRAVVAGFALQQISEGNYADDREDEDEDQAPEEDEGAADDEPEEELEEEPEEEPEPPKRSRGRSSGSKTNGGSASRSARAKK